MTAKWWITFRALFEARSIHMAGAVWPEYEQVAFRGAAELEERLDRFTQDESSRAVLAASMRRVAEERCSYAALAPGLLRFISDGLGGRSKSLNDRPQSG